MQKLLSDLDQRTHTQLTLFVFFSDLSCGKNADLKVKGESEHKNSKANFNRTNKSSVTQGLTNIDQIKSFLRKIEERVAKESRQDQLRSKSKNERDPRRSVIENLSYKISKRGHRFQLGDWLRIHQYDLSTKVRCLFSR